MEFLQTVGKLGKCYCYENSSTAFLLFNSMAISNTDCGYQYIINYNNIFSFYRSPRYSCATISFPFNSAVISSIVDKPKSVSILMNNRYFLLLLLHRADYLDLLCYIQIINCLNKVKIDRAILKPINGTAFCTLGSCASNVIIFSTLNPEFLKCQSTV